MLPKVDGLEVIRRLRAQHEDVPIVVLSAKGDEADKVLALSLGADDYVTKPFDTPELVARVGAVLRRRASAMRLLEEDRMLVQRMEELLRQAPIARLDAAEAPTTAGGRLDGGRVVVDLDAAMVLVSGRPITTSAAEYALLRILLSYPGRVVTRTELIERTWGPGAADGHTLLVATNTGQAIAPYLLKLKYDPLKDLQPIGLVAIMPNILVVSADSPYKSVKDLVAAMKAKPGTFKYGSSGIGSTQHIAGEAVHDERYRSFLFEAARHGVEQLVLADLRGGRLVLDRRGRVPDLDVRHGACAAFAAEQ